MSILDTKYLKKLRIKYVIFTIFILLLGFIYQRFSHNVYSNFMSYAFIIPLVMGVIVISFIKDIDKISLSLYHSSIITFTLGSIVKGVLDIYGTTNKLVYGYLIVGVLLFISFLSSYVKNKV